MDGLRGLLTYQFHGSDGRWKYTTWNGSMGRNSHVLVLFLKKTPKLGVAPSTFTTHNWSWSTMTQMMYMEQYLVKCVHWKPFKCWIPGDILVALNPHHHLCHVLRGNDPLMENRETEPSHWVSSPLLCFRHARHIAQARSAPQHSLRNLVLRCIKWSASGCPRRI